MLTIGDEDEGIEITYYKTKREIEIGGHYDGGWCGIEGTRMPLGAFLRRLGVTVKDCERALSDKDA
mgnify:FL=1